MALVWGIVKVVVAAVVVAHLVCLVVALYEMLNLPEMRLVRLTPTLLAGVLRGLVVETVGAIVAVLAIPLGALPWRRIPDELHAERPPIVFVPGYLMTRSCLWILRRRLARAGWRDAVGYNYRSVGGGLRRAARDLATLVDAVAARAGVSHVVVIAHGMGGLVARLSLHERPHPAVRALVTLGTPHQGSKLYALALDPMAQEMRAGSALLEELGTEDALPCLVDVTAIYSSFDLTIVPASAARYPGASNIEIEGVGHIGLLWSARVAELVRENLEYALETLGARKRVGAAAADDPHAAPSACTHRATSSASE